MLWLYSNEFGISSILKAFQNVKAWQLIQSLGGFAPQTPHKKLYNPSYNVLSSKSPPWIIWLYSNEFGISPFLKGLKIHIDSKLLNGLGELCLLNLHNQPVLNCAVFKIVIWMLYKCYDYTPMNFEFHQFWEHFRMWKLGNWSRAWGALPPKPPIISQIIHHTLWYLQNHPYEITILKAIWKITLSKSVSDSESLTIDPELGGLHPPNPP